MGKLGNVCHGLLLKIRLIKWFIKEKTTLVRNLVAAKGCLASLSASFARLRAVSPSLPVLASLLKFGTLTTIVLKLNH